MNKLEKQIGKIWRTVRGKSQSRYKEDEEEAMEERERSSSLGRIRGRERRRDKENGAEEWEGFGYSTSPHLALPKRASRVSLPSVAFKKKIKRTQPLEKEKRPSSVGRRDQQMAQICASFQRIGARVSNERTARMMAEEEDLEDPPMKPRLITPSRRSLSSRHVDKEKESPTYADSIGYESGYLSNLELNSSKDYLSDVSSPYISPRELQMSARAKASQKSMGELRSQRQSRKAAGMSRADTVGVLTANNFVSHHEFLRRNILKTKIITCVFEVVDAGLEALLEDVLHELQRWFGGQQPLLAVACELQWSVPEKRRCRNAESRLKDGVLLRLRENNRRLLNLRGFGRQLPLQLADATTHEKCTTEKNLNAFQGVYRRCYRNLLPYVHEETPEWHAEYWRVNEKGSEQAIPRPEQFLFGQPTAVLATTSLVSINMAGLQIRGNPV